MLKNNLFQLFVAIDQVLNVFLGMIFEPKRAHWADETMSSYAHRLRIERNIFWVERVIDALFFLQKDHCKTAYESERARKHFPPELRG